MKAQTDQVVDSSHDNIMDILILVDPASRPYDSLPRVGQENWVLYPLESIQTISAGKRPALSKGEIRGLSFAAVS